MNFWTLWWPPWAPQEDELFLSGTLAMLHLEHSYNNSISFCKKEAAHPTGTLPLTCADICFNPLPTGVCRNVSFLGCLPPRAHVEVLLLTCQPTTLMRIVQHLGFDLSEPRLYLLHFWSSLALGTSHPQSSPLTPLPAAPGFVQPFAPT